MRLSSDAIIKWSLRLGSLVAFALIWEVTARQINNILLPGFSETLQELFSLLASKDLWHALWVSNQAMLLGFALGVIVGVPLGLLIGRWSPAEIFIDPYLTILLATPMAALIPIIIMATGLGLASRVLIVFLFAFVVITINTRAGLRNLEPGWIEMAHAFGATETQIWRKVLLPGTLPAILTGLRLGLARAISGMLMVELVLLALGVGRLILSFQVTLESARLYATVLVIVAEAVILMQSIKWLERRAVPWSGQGAAS